MPQTHKEETLESLGKQIRDIRTAMFTTLDQESTLWSRPMAIQEMDETGTLWFFTARDSGKAQEVAGGEPVNITYAKPDDSLYVSITGIAEVVDDIAKKKELWNPFVKAWFPEGPEDPNVVLLKVIPERAEYWQGPSTGVGRLVSVAAKLVSGGKTSSGKDVKVTLP